MDTIYALATGQGRAGVAVIRVSGPRVSDVVTRLAGTNPSPRQAVLRRLHSREGELLDEALVLRFVEGASFTGEDVAEFHLHGGTAVVNGVLRELSVFEGCRLAEPGEFTRRALEAGRLDLAQVEGLADLIDAETDVQRRQALQSFDGAAAGRIEGWREALISGLALLEATIDFADEEVPVDVMPDVRLAISGVVGDLRNEIVQTERAERVRDGFEVAILGAPNAGKSTLLNTLAGREAAITSDIAGTTRDVIEVRMDVHGIPVTFLDTAGLRDAEDQIEKAGIARARARAGAADLRIFLLLPGESAAADLCRDGDIVVDAKADLHGSGVSGLTGLGVGELIDAVARELEGRVPTNVRFIRERHRLALMRALEALQDARDLMDADGDQSELIAESVWTGVRALESILGKVDIEAVLDDIFARFCLGK